MAALSGPQSEEVKSFFDGVEQLQAYNDYTMEDVLLEAAHVQLCPIRKKNTKRTLPPYIAYVQHYYRKMIETVGSLLERMLPKTIHAVTAAGFELKVFLFVLAYSINCL